MPRTLRRALVFLAGLALIVIGLVLIVLPGPLTIPPILAGVWLWSREFEFARRWLRPVQTRGAAAWEQAKAKPLWTATVTVVGLLGAVAIVWAALRYHLLAHAWRLLGGG